MGCADILGWHWFSMIEFSPFLPALKGVVCIIADAIPLLRLPLAGSGPFGLDTSIEGMNSQKFSVGIFYFLVVAIFIFTAFIFLFMFKSKGAGLKTGEKWLFAWLLFGVFAALAFGATQLLHGYLF